ncbi:MAG TPA: Crp/Fnr family transcriptional regulator [Terriglobales bacterium]|jgi:CRP/FNR family cyclic AMP-dependent transcriptional regulator|nr:Crp/Fnr family transcriptional regulator [Terriglobales bacterium]
MNSPYGLPCVENCLTCQLRSEKFFCDLPKESLEAFNQIKHAAVYPEHAVIFVEGQTPRGIFMLCQGQAKLSTTSKDGKTFILRIAKAGEVLGLHATVTGRSYELTVETIRPCQLNFVSRQDFLPFLKKHGDACLRATQHVSRDCQDAYDLVRTIGLSHSISGRLAKFLLESSGEGEVANGVVRTKLALTHEDISQLIGTRRETITRTLSEFRKLRIVELKGSTLIIRNKTALVKLVAA